MKKLLFPDDWKVSTALLKQEKIRHFPELLISVYHENEGDNSKGTSNNK